MTRFERRSLASLGRQGVVGRLSLIGVVLLAAACTPTTQTAAPTSTTVLGIDWGRTSEVEGPPNFLVTVPPDYQGAHPILRFPGQAILADVLESDGKLLTVGYVPPDWTPAAWTSSDGLSWAYHEIGATPFTFPVALARGGGDGGGTIVAVGRQVSDPVAWTSADGVTWQIHEVPSLGGKGAERMNAVVATSSGYVAGGSAGPELFDRHARFWTSPDGVTWQPVADDPVAFADAEVTSIASLGDTLVAVGALGPAQHRTGGVAWTSTDGTSWTRIDDPVFHDAFVASIIVAPFGGVLAVGSDIGKNVALAWLSDDGHVWRKVIAGDYGDRRHLWMTDVAAIGQAVVAVGTSQATQRAAATSWISTDGVAWEQAGLASTFEQVELFAVSKGGPGVISVGVFGGPDSAVPAILVSPGSGNLRAQP